jgi:hypothetical protein
MLCLRSSSHIATVMRAGFLLLISTLHTRGLRCRLTTWEVGAAFVRRWIRSSQSSRRTQTTALYGQVGLFCTARITLQLRALLLLHVKETIWFDMWWRLQNASTQATFRDLVARGQLEFVGGGYVQSDEATTTFADVIDQTTTGHEILRAALPGLPPPNHGWQVRSSKCQLCWTVLLFLFLSFMRCARSTCSPGIQA